jgi:effector-binding domain-containing protein
MSVNRAHAVSHPMVYVTARASMDPGDISGKVGKAFDVLGGFMAQNHVTATGAPLAIYRDWDGKTMAVDVGFPVTAIDLGKAAGEVLAGRSPEGPVVRAMHRGSYASLRDTYGKLESEISEAGLKPSGLSWEVYLKGPGMAEEKDYVTEIYTQLADAEMNAEKARVG